MQHKAKIIGGRLLWGLWLFFSNKYFRYWLLFLLTKPLGKRYIPAYFKWAGIKFHVPDALSFFWQFNEIFVKDSYQFPRTTSNPVIIDCGSNVGCSIAYYVQKYPGATVIGFEPDASIFKYLTQNISFNQFQGVELHQKAVWVSDGTVSFNSEGADGGSISQGSSSGNIESVDLNRILEGIESVDFLKIDIEGAEVKVVPNIAENLHKVRNIFIEYHAYKDETMALSAILKTLEENHFDYTIESEVNHKNPYERLRNSNNIIFQANIFAINKSFSK